MKAIIAISLTLALSAVSAKAQECTTQKPCLKMNHPSWYIEAGAGVQTIFSSDASGLDFGKRITPDLTFAVGRWITPAWGVRLQLQGYALNSFATARGIYVNDPVNNGSIYGNQDPITDHVTVNPDGSYRTYLRYLNAHIDVTASLGTLLGMRSRFDVIPAVGLGYAHAFSHKGSAKTNSLTANFSLMAKYRILRNLDANFEVATAVMPDHFDGRISGKNYEPTLGATLGLTYRFGGKKQCCSKRDAAPVEKVIVKHDTITTVKRVEVPVEKVVQQKLINRSFTLGSVHFDLGKSEAREGQENVYINVTKFLKENPKARIRLDGYADKETGTERQNLVLSMRRVTYVLNKFLSEYGIERNRIDAQGIGDNAQPYEENDLNRVVIITVIVE
ncbi:MAG: OmpA family protein [Muribaculaceae bacterium]